MGKKLMTARRRAHRSAVFSGLSLTGMGVLHLVKPEPFDALIPEQLPGTARQWSIGSGYAELATAALLLVPRTRRIGGAAAAALFVGVWPGNVKMAWDWRHEPAVKQVVSLGRLPLQIPLIVQAVRIARNA
ncbi:hypothetical protein [Kocuria sp.]|uniref:DoxX family protein n=1 Tax=Kocuria sp. TaxID=1871328 RepID=UPI0026DD072E|nr:hypothetical protein [Kocuria sp.]MDO4918981.1 hypothetical protein [Kocuria sp.]